MLLTCLINSFVLGIVLLAGSSQLSRTSKVGFILGIAGSILTYGSFIAFLFSMIVGYW